jgi:hypothetical protein
LKESKGIHHQSNNDHNWFRNYIDITNRYGSLKALELLELVYPNEKHICKIEIYRQSFKTQWNHPILIDHRI